MNAWDRKLWGVEFSTPCSQETLLSWRNTNEQASLSARLRNRKLPGGHGRAALPRPVVADLGNGLRMLVRKVESEMI